MSNDFLSKSFRLSEFISSGDIKTLSNERKKEIEERIRKKLIPILQPMRDFLGLKIRITSGHRNPEHNNAAGGKHNSHHLYNADQCACDITCENLPAVWLWLKSNRKQFCYAYWNRERKFIHISGLTDYDSLHRIGAMWIYENNENTYE